MPADASVRCTAGSRRRRRQRAARTSPSPYTTVVSASAIVRRSYSFNDDMIGTILMNDSCSLRTPRGAHNVSGDDAKTPRAQCTPAVFTASAKHASPALLHRRRHQRLLERCLVQRPRAGGLRGNLWPQSGRRRHKHARQGAQGSSRQQLLPRPRTTVAARGASYINASSPKLPPLDTSMTCVPTRAKNTASVSMRKGRRATLRNLRRTLPTPETKMSQWPRSTT